MRSRIKLGKDSFFEWNKTEQGLITGLGFNKAFDIYVAERAAAYMNPFVPMRKGVLSQNYVTGVDDRGGFVKYTSPYAHYQYNGVGFDFSKEQHPLATHHWDKAMYQADGVEFVAEADRIRKRFAK